jgi:hypothetical protein
VGIALTASRLRAEGATVVRRVADAPSGSRPLVAIAAILLAGLAVALVLGGAPGRLIVVCLFGVAAAWGVSRAPSVALGALPATQAADWIRVQTALASIAPRTVLIALLALQRSRAFASLLRARVDLRFVTGALGIWWLLAPLRSSHSTFDESPLRGLVTDGSFVAITFIAATFASDTSALRNVARGSASAILVLGLASLLVSVGWLAEPERTSPGREIFGIQSPFSRNYGFDVPWDAVALLVPLCVPYYLFILLDSRTGDRRSRIEAFAALGLLSLVITLLFQSRGMLAQLVIAGVAMSFLAGRHILAFAGTAVLAVGVVAAAHALVDVDAISTNIRLKTDVESIATTFGSVRTALTGVDEERVVGAVLADPALGGATASFSSVPIHNLFLGTLVTGGVVSLLALLSVVGYAGFRLLRSDLTQPSTKILLVAFVLVVVEMNIEPLRANVIGAWLILGLALGLEAPRAREVEHGLPASRTTRWRRRAHSPA